MDTSRAYFLEAARANVSPPQKSREAYEGFPSIDKIRILFFFPPASARKGDQELEQQSGWIVLAQLLKCQSGVLHLA